MKIAIIVHNLTGGGAERVAALWARGFAARGNKVTVIIYDDNSPVTYKLLDSVELNNIASHMHGKIMRVVDRMLKLRVLLKKEKYQVVIDVMPDYWKIIAMLGLRCMKISTEHWSFERPVTATIKPKKIKKIYLNRMYDHVTVLTQADKDVIGKQLKHYTVLPNPLALEPVTEFPIKDKVVLAVGRIDAWYYKGFDILIKAWARVSSEADGWYLKIAGEGSVHSLSYLIHLCEEEQISGSVDFIGYQSDILPYYQSASIFVLSSRYEGFGVVLIEAMSQGCACVACDYKGRQKEIISSEDQGILCEPDNVESLSKAILSLIHDEDKRRYIGTNAIARASDFCIDNIMDRWDLIISKIYDENINSR